MKEKEPFKIGICTIAAGFTLMMFGYTPFSHIISGLGLYTVITGITNNINGFKQLWTNTKLHIEEDYPLLLNKHETPYGHILRFTLPVGLSTDDFEKKRAAISQYLGNPIEINYNNKNMFIKVYDKQLDKEYPFELIDTKGILELVIGYEYGAKIVTVDLTDGLPHMLIAGETGSGKSTILRSIITTIILTKNPHLLELYLIDLKNGAEFGIFRKCSMVKSFSRNTGEAEAILYKLQKEVDNRYDLFYKSDCVDIVEYNKKHKKKKLTYKLLIIDEFADLMNEKDSISIMETLAAKSRACGIHLLISTQRPDAKVLNGRIKANVPVVLGLKCLNEINSRVIIDHKGLEELRGKGHGILRNKGETEIQSMNLSATEARNLLKPYYENKAGIKEINKIGEAEDLDCFNKI